MAQQSFRRAVAWVGAAAVLVTLSSSAWAVRATDQLTAAIELYGQKNFAQARAAFLELQRQRDQLSETQRIVLDQHVAVVDNAMTHQAMLLDQLAAAEAALQAGMPEQAAAMIQQIQSFQQDDLTPADLLRPADLARADKALAAVKQAAGQPVVARQDAEPPAEAEVERVETDIRMTEAITPADEDPTDAQPEAAPAAADSGPSVDFGAGSARNVPDRSALGQFTTTMRIMTDMTRQRVEDQLRLVFERVAANRFDDARLELEFARNSLDARRRYFDPPTEYQALLDKINQTAVAINEAERTYNEALAEAEKKEIVEQIRRREEEARRQKQDRKEFLLVQARQLQEEDRLAESINKLDEVIALDPTDNSLKLARNSLERLLHYRTVGGYYRERQAKVRTALGEIEEGVIPVIGLLEFPDDWREISARRDASNLTDAGEDQRTIETRRRLASPIPRLAAYTNTEFSRVIDNFASITGLNIVVDWNALREEGVERSSSASLSPGLTDVSVSQALEIVLGSVEGGGGLAYRISQGVILVSTKAKLAAETELRVYDIADVIQLQIIPNFRDAPNLTLDSTGTDNVFDSGDDEDDTQERFDEQLEELVELIEQSANADGDANVTINRIGSQLVVRHNERGHETIRRLLNQLRQSRAVQVNVETRFLSVQSNFLEEIGVDIDVILNSGTAGFDRTGLVNSYNSPILAPSGAPGGPSGSQILVPRQNVRNGFLPAFPQGPVPTPYGSTVGLSNPYVNPAFVPPYGQFGPSAADWTPIPILNNALALTNPANLTSTVPGSFAGQAIAPAFSIIGSFLDNLQVDFLIRATQANSRSTILQAPRLTLYNGQRAWVAILQEQAYVSDLTPVVADNVASFDPTIDRVFTGAVLDVQATVSADRKYVTMTVRPGTASVVAIQNFQFQLTPAFGTTVGGVVQLPLIRRTSLKTTVTVPDKGTLLLGGQKLSTETEIEAGVPILSKIPVLKRAFDNRTVIKDDQTLLILIRPQIIDTAEIEEFAFPAPAVGGSGF